MNTTAQLAKARFEEAKKAMEEGTPEGLQRAEGLLKEAQELKTQAVREADLLARMAADLTDIQGLEDKSAPRPVQPAVNPRFGSAEEWLNAVTQVYLQKGHDHRLQLWNDMGDRPYPFFNEAKQMVESVGASGGFLVPTENYGEIMAIAAERSIVRGHRPHIIRMRRRQMDITVLDQTGTTAGVPHWFGGMLFYWGDEAAEKTLTTAKWRQVSLVAKKLIGYTRASDELVDDAVVSLSDFLAGPYGFAGGVAWMEDFAFLQGTGVGQPLGVINAGATISVARAVAGPGADPVTYADLTHMLEHHLQTDNSVWVASISLKDVLMNMTYPSGNPSLVWQPNARDGMPGQILGIPVVWTEKAPLAGSAGDLGLYDFQHYLIGDRQAITIDTTNAEYFKYDQTSWRVVHRVDGRPWMNTCLTLQDGTTTVSPFVILGAKST